MTNDNPFTRFARAGYGHRLLPIVQPGADISPNSSLARPDRQKDIGKTPGVRGVNGWHGLPDWQKVVSTEELCEAWGRMEAGVGMKMGDGLVAVDIDAMDKDQAHICAQTATEILGASENRVGRSPKRAKLYRVSEPVPYARVTFDGGHVEVLSDGRQLVVSGIHPATQLPYEWPRGVPRCEDLPVVDAALVAKYMAALAERLPAAKVEASSLPAADRRAADPAQLIGREADVRRAIEALPNNKRFDTYASYIEVAQAIKGALPDDDEAGLELFQEWAAKWEGGSNNPDRVAADWHRCKASHSLGAQYLFSLAETLGQGNFTAAEAWFDAVPPGAVSENPFEIADGAGGIGIPDVEPIQWCAPTAWEGASPSPREWEVTGWIPRDEVTLLYGEGGVGKTLIAHQYAVAAASGTPWLGQETRQARVMFLACEDSENELHRRHKDICAQAGVTIEQLGDRMRIASRKYLDNLLAVWMRSTNEMKRTSLWHQLKADAEAFGADVVIVDTLADTFGGSEIDRTQVNSFVKACLGPLARTVVALGHPSVGGRAEGRSGSTAWANAARSRMYLQYPKGKETGNWRELVGTKANYGPKGASIRLQWESGAFKAWGKPRGPEIDLNPLNGSAGSAPAALPAVEDIAERAVLECLSWAEADQMPLNLAPTSKTYAPKILKRHYGRALDMLKLEDVEAAIVELQSRGVIRAASWYDGAHRHRVTGFAIVRDVGALD